jgi:hypothetical protein
MGTAIERHSAVTDLHRRGEGFGVPGMRCDGMDVVATREVMSEAIQRARDDRQPILVEAITYRFRGHSMADPEEYRTKEQVAEWRKRDPIATFGDQLVAEGVIDEEERERMDAEAIARVDDAVTFADNSPFPAPESLYDNVYVLGGQTGWYSVDERSAGVHKGEDERKMAAEELTGGEQYRSAVAAARVGEDTRPADDAQEEEDGGGRTEDRGEGSHADAGSEEGS